MILENNSHELFKLVSFIYNLLNVVSKTQKNFENKGDLIFSQICPEDKISQNRVNFELKINIWTDIKSIIRVKY